jgi:hypothetical protein
MRLKLLDIILLLVIAIGGFLALRSAQEHVQLRQEYTRLVQITGDLPIGDSKKLHLRAIDTRDPMHYAWRVYLPPNFKWELRSAAIDSSSSGSTRSRDFIARVRFRIDEQGVLQVYTHFLDGSSLTRLGDERLAAFLKDRWNRLRVQQLGSADVVAMTQDDAAVLLRLTMPDDMAVEARQLVPPGDQPRYVPDVFDLKLGPRVPSSQPAQPGK